MKLVSFLPIVALLLHSAVAEPKFNHLTAETSVNLAEATSLPDIHLTGDRNDLYEIDKRAASDWELDCSGSDLSAYAHKCGSTPLSGLWCQEYCQCAVGGGKTCTHNLPGCQSELIYGVCNSGQTQWKCVCRNKNTGLVKDE